MGFTREDAARKPRICAISYKSLSRLIHSVIPRYAPLAEIRIVDKLFDDALDTARDLVAAREVDVFLSAGANGAFLRNNVTVPVVLIKVSGFDILRALLKAREISKRIAIVTYQATSAELEEVKQLLKLNVEQRSYTTIEDARDCFRDLAADGYKVIVGSSLITDLAEEAGLTGIFLYSRNSVCQALNDAIEIARIARIEEARRERINTILQHLNEGVVAVDMEERIESVNPAMEKLLGVASEWAIGRRLSEIAPALGLDPTLRTGVTELEQLQTVGKRTVVVNRLPIREHGVQTGAVLTSQDSTTIERVDRNIRSRNRPRHFTAKYQFAQIVGNSPAIGQAKALAAQYARTDSTVLITGESGTGKELFAQSIHNASRRRNHPFVAINCAAFPESLLESELFGYEEGAFSGSRRGGKAGLFECAHTGTIFLDEIGDMPVALQTRLLRVLQEREVLRLGGNDPTPVDVRVIASTHCDLQKHIEDGKFREDLFYRLNILHLNLPPLRERRADIRVIADYLLRDALRRLASSARHEHLLDAVLPFLETHLWPGNIREMENVIERIAVFVSDAAGAEVDPSWLRAIVPELFARELPFGVPSAGSRALKSVNRANELSHIRRVIDECRGDHAEAAKRLGISRTTLWRKLGSGSGGLSETAERR